MLLSIVWFMVIQSRSRAQTNDLFRFDANYPGARSLFPSVMFNNNIKDLLVDEGSIQRVVTILQSNIKQWSFVESQLLEPNVNLGMVRARRVCDYCHLYLTPPALVILLLLLLTRIFCTFPLFSDTHT